MVMRTSQLTSSRTADGKARINQYQFGPTLGMGNYGKVKQCTNLRTG